MAHITFEYDPDKPDNVEIGFNIAEKDNLDSSKLAEVLSTGVNSVIVSCWDTNEEREKIALLVAKLLLVAIDKRRGDDDEN